MVLATHFIAMIKKLSITTKLTILFSILLTCSLLIIGVYSYLNVWTLLYKNDAEHLRAQAKPLINKLLFNNNVELKEVAQILARDLTSKSISAIIIDNSLKILAKGKVLPEEPEAVTPNFHLIKRALKGEKDITYITKINSYPVLVVLIPLKKGLYNNEIIGVAQLNTSLLPLYKILYKHGAMLIIVSIIVLIIGAILSFYIVSKSLLNLKNIVEVCKKVSLGDFTQHLNYEGNDEITIVANAFDNMLDKIKNIIDSQKRFVANAAHELRTPLSSIKTSCEILLRGAQDNPALVSKLTKTIYKEINRIINICEKLLSLAKLDKRFELNLKKVDIEKFLKSFFEKTKIICKNKKFTLQEGDKTYILVDEDILTQILLDLISNAIQFTDKNGKISLGWKSSNEEVIIFVKDNGIGINSDDLKKIFEPFFQGENSKYSNGSGLGLTFVKAMIDAHNGKIEILSQPLEGTAVYLHFKKINPLFTIS